MVELQYVSFDKGKKCFTKVEPGLDQKPNGNGDGHYQFLLTEELVGNSARSPEGITAHLICSDEGAPLSPFYIGRNIDQITASFAAERAVEVTVTRKESRMRNHHRMVSTATLTITRHSTGWVSGGHEKEELLAPVKVCVLDEANQLDELLAKIPDNCACFREVAALAWGKTFDPESILYANVKKGQKDPRPPLTSAYIQALAAQ